MLRGFRFNLVNTAFQGSPRQLEEGAARDAHAARDRWRQEGSSCFKGADYSESCYERMASVGYAYGIFEVEDSPPFEAGSQHDTP